MLFILCFIQNYIFSLLLCLVSLVMKNVLFSSWHYSANLFSWNFFIASNVWQIHIFIMLRIFDTYFFFVIVVILHRTSYAYKRLCYRSERFRLICVHVSQSIRRFCWNERFFVVFLWIYAFRRFESRFENIKFISL